MSDSVRPHRRQPTRLRHPWDSPGKNTGAGYHFLLQCMKVKSESEVAQSCLTQRPHGLQPTRLPRPWDFPGKSTGVGCHCLFWQGSPNRGNRLQVSDIFYLSLKQQEETNYKCQIFFPSLYKFKNLQIQILCCHDNTWFHLNLTFPKP